MASDPIEIDALGMRCPIPVKLTRKALKEIPEGDAIQLIGDDPESLHDIPALLERLGLVPPEISSSEGFWRYLIRNEKRS